MAKIALGILTGILIFIAAGVLAVFWVGKMRREMEEKRPRLAYVLQDKRPATFFASGSRPSL